MQSIEGVIQVRVEGNRALDRWNDGGLDDRGILTENDGIEHGIEGAIDRGIEGEINM